MSVGGSGRAVSIEMRLQSPRRSFEPYTVQETEKQEHLIPQSVLNVQSDTSTSSIQTQLTSCRSVWELLCGCCLHLSKRTIEGALAQRESVFSLESRAVHGPAPRRRQNRNTELVLSKSSESPLTDGWRCAIMCQKCCRRVKEKDARRNFSTASMTAASSATPEIRLNCVGR